MRTLHLDEDISGAEVHDGGVGSDDGNSNAAVVAVAASAGAADDATGAALAVAAVAGDGTPTIKRRSRPCRRKR